MKKLLALALAILMLLSAMTAASAETLTEYPREETMYLFMGMGALPSTLNPLVAGESGWPTGTSIQLLLYETPFMMNMLTGELEPLVCDSYTVNDDHSITVKVNEKAHFNDGTPCTAKDIVYAYNLGAKYALNWSDYWTNIESVEAMDDTTFIIKQKADAINTPNVLDSLQIVTVLPEHIWSKVEEDAGYDIMKIREFLNLDNPVATGCYKIHNITETGVYMIRDDNYWGVERFGKLPTPKYLANLIYKSNDLLAVALENNEVDFAQAFIPAINEMSARNPKVGTYYSEPPYHLEGGMVTAVFNMTVPGLDNVDVRRAIAYAINYDMVGQLAMSGYTKEVVPLLALTNGVEDKYIDKDALSDLFWSYDVAKANEILDGIGAARGADGIRVLPDGTRLSFTIQSGYGWTDWNAACEVVAQSCRDAGIEIICEMPESAVFMSNRQTGDFEITLNIPGENPRPSQPWFRYRDILSSDFLAPIGEIAFGNLGRYENAEASALVDKLPNATEEAELIELHTEINRIYLEDVPLIPIMYRPFQFYEFNETYWTGFPTADNGSEIPPMLDRGAGLRTFFAVEPAK